LLNAIISDIWTKKNEDLPDVHPFSGRVYQKCGFFMKRWGWNYDPAVMK